MTAPTKARFDDHSFYWDDPHTVFRSLRESDPVHWYADGGFWVVTRYSDIKAISAHPEKFTSERIAILMDLIAHREGRDPRNYKNRGILFMDPPEHRAHRRAVQVRFTPAEVAKAEARIQQVVSDVFDALPDGEFDWISRVAEPIPVYIFAYLLGVPEADWPKVSSWATTIVAVANGEVGDDGLDIIFGEIAPYLMDLVSVRAKQPTGDLLSALSLTEVHGRKFDEIEVMNYALTLLAAGSETTQSLIAGLATCLDQHPEQAEILYANPELAGNAVEETLRWWTPVVSMARQAAVDVQIGATTIKSGDGLLLAYGSANRDASHWGDHADLFDVTRPDAGSHLGFGVGEHFCMGAALARREGRLVVEELLRRTRGLRVTGQQVPRPSALVHTYEHLDVTLDRR